MSIFNLLSKQTAEKGIHAKHGKEFSFVIKRIRTLDGNQQYQLENTSRKENISILREYFDRFRAALKEVEQDYHDAEAAMPSKIRRIYFKDQELFTICLASEPNGLIEIYESSVKTRSGGVLRVSKSALSTLISLLYHHKLDHPSDTFDRIVKYHKLFHFSFTEGSESITSGLILRRDVLSQIDEYIPPLARKIVEQADQWQGGEQDAASTGRASAGARKNELIGSGKFKPKLGQKDKAQSYEVDYEALFQSQFTANVDKDPRSADDQTKRGSQVSSTCFHLPLQAGDIKAFSKFPFRCELSQEEGNRLRENFLQDRDCELYLGFEILDAIFRSSGKFKTYRFPLYYMKVSLEEAGRVIYIHPDKNGEIFLNHLALATLVESFGAAKAGSGDHMEQFFQTILSQNIEIEGRLSRLQISRLLPVHDEVFDRIRELLIGLPGENGKGGILGNLKVIGIACDLEAVALYKSSQGISPVRKALEQDLDRIHAVTHEEPERFYQSLLGQVLNPELKREKVQGWPFCERPYLPGALPKSTKKLMERLNEYDLVLLEGPPGTGKTFTIMNLLIHCINTDKKLLIVSDQKAAIHALIEKVEEYLIGRDRSSPLAKSYLTLWRHSIKIVDDLPNGPVSLQQWMTLLGKMLGLADAREMEHLPADTKLDESIMKIDQEIESLHREIQLEMDRRVHTADPEYKVAPKNCHPTTAEDIKDLIAFLDFLGLNRKNGRHQSAEELSQLDLTKAFIAMREDLLNSALAATYDDFALDAANAEANLERIKSFISVICRLIAEKPRTQLAFEAIIKGLPESQLVTYLEEAWHQSFPATASTLQQQLKRFFSLFRHPLVKTWKKFQLILIHQRDLLQAASKKADGDRILRQFQLVHEALGSGKDNLGALSLEICRARFLPQQQLLSSVQSRLLQIKQLQKQRDALVKDCLIHKLSQIAHKTVATDPRKKTSPLTSVTTLHSALQESASIEHGSGHALLRDFQEALIQAFPVWICRKQAVSFLFPSREQLFDLVIVDEAGQCRVDDAIPLLYRAKKFMVVGDEKQTVLDKNSVIDDYLFKDFNLDEHLSHTHARAMKGGGSNIFALVKSMKQASVMLDEHYRCPPEIIRYSNEYVYDSALKVMQWQHPAKPHAVVVDYSERNKEVSKRPKSGKFKDIDVEVVDRFLDFIASSVKKIEKETGRRINMETDVAICYFLLKNEPYIKEVKSHFLQKLGRGSDVLDGAGAALQGKERDFIFYLWDVTRSNLRAFRQGDDPDKRKGELNVLMSRPKVRAYHYLHPQFETLKHETASITDYLWKAYQRQSQKQLQTKFAPRKIRPGVDFFPWHRSSGELMYAIFSRIWQSFQADQGDRACPEAQYSVVVGNPKYKVDLMLLNSDINAPSLGLVDLSVFSGAKPSAQEIVDYYFQLERAVPQIEPVFLFLHELADERSESFRYLMQRLKPFLARKQAA